MDQLALALTQPGIRHNQSPEAIDPIAGLKARLAEMHADLLARFRDLELASCRAPNPIRNEKDAATATDLIVQCQLHLKQVEAAHKQEKALFLRAGRAVDAFFFGGRSERLSAALAPTVARLKAYRDRVTAVEALRLADEERSEAVRQIASSSLEPNRVRGNYGATAFIRRSWSFEVVDLDQVPSEYMNLDVPVVRAAITQDGIRYIPGLRIVQTEVLRVRATPSLGSKKAPPQREPATEKENSADAAEHRSSDQSRDPRTPKRRGRIRSASDPRLVVRIKPIWGDQKVLRYYRQALASLQPHDAAEITKFRGANAAIEARLRRKLPYRMEEIDFLYGGLGGSRAAGEGTPK